MSNRPGKHLHSGNADAAAGAEHEQALAGLKLGALQQRQVRRAERHRQPRRLGHVHAVWWVHQPRSA